ncbi:MAG: spore maturation protein [Deltaproteobacteria bacterium]|nr:spore maturation protein [Deltaproteobacteria bacterium]
MLNAIWLVLVATSLLVAAASGPEAVARVTDSIFESAKSAVQLVIGLVGVMVFFLGLMRIAFDAGLREAVARWLAPVMRRLFPEIPADHPAMGAMVMNFASNILGMGNAATPFGLKAMNELARLNRHAPWASNAMVLFLAVNASSITLLPPLGTIGVRAAAHSADPWAIWMPTLFATLCSTAAAIATYFLLKPLPLFAPPALAPSAGAAVRVDAPAIGSTRSADEGEPDPTDAGPSARAARNDSEPSWRRSARRALVGLALLGFAASVVAAFRSDALSHGAGIAARNLLQQWTLPALLLAVLAYGFARRVPVYDSMVAGGREALEVASRIVPYLVVILVAVGMLRASGALDAVIGWIDPFTSQIGVPAEVLPMALIRPLSGSGALGVMSEIITTHGPDSFIGMLTCTLMGSTETTFYVLAVYFGAAGVVDGRHALACCLAADVAGFLGAVAACRYFFG